MTATITRTHGVITEADLDLTRRTQPGRHRRPLGWMPSVFGLGLGHAGRRLFDTVTGSNRTDHVGRHRATCDVPRREVRRAMGRLMGVLAALVLLMAALPAPARADVVDGCQRITLDGYSDAVVAELVADGWTGRADDGVEALYAPTCPAEVDTWPVGTVLDGVPWDMLPPIFDTVAETLWTVAYVDAGWTVLDPDALPGHGTCMALIGDTTTVQCADGTTFES